MRKSELVEAKEEQERLVRLGRALRSSQKGYPLRNLLTELKSFNTFLTVDTAAETTVSKMLAVLSKEAGNATEARTVQESTKPHVYALAKTFNEVKRLAEGAIALYEHANAMRQKAVAIEKKAGVELNIAEIVNSKTLALLRNLTRIESNRVARKIGKFWF